MSPFLKYGKNLASSWERMNSTSFEMSFVYNISSNQECYSTLNMGRVSVGAPVPRFLGKFLYTLRSAPTRFPMLLLDVNVHPQLLIPNPS